jgi:hypothetical protein
MGLVISVRRRPGDLTQKKGDVSHTVSLIFVTLLRGVTGHETCKFSRTVICGTNAAKPDIDPACPQFTKS